MKKTYVLDTNVILYSPRSILCFEDANVVIPEVVLEELDALKKKPGELGANARMAARILDELRIQGSLIEGIKLPNGGKLRVEVNHHNIEIPPYWDKSKADNRIIQVCKGLKERGEDVYLITKDIFERIKADTIGINTNDYYEKVVPEYDNQYTGRISVYTSSDNIDYFYKNKYLDVKQLKIYVDKSKEYKSPELYVNEFIIMHSYENA